MSDILSNLSTETLTAAVASLFQRPLPDSEISLTQCLKPGAKGMTRSKSTLAGLPIPANLSFVGDNLYSSASSSSLPSIASLPNITSNLSGSVSHDPHTSIQDSAVTANTAKSIATRSQTDSLSRKAAIKLTSHGNKKKSNSTRQRHKNKLKAEKAGTSHQLHQVDSASKGHETVRKLLEISKHTLKKEDVCSMTDFASSAGKPQLSLQENSSSIDSLHITTSTALTTGSIINLPHDTRINFSANAALSAVITSTNVVSSDVSLPLTCLPHEHNLRDGEADVSSIAQVTTSHSIRLSPHFQDGLLPMLSIGPGLNIPLLIRPAGTQLVSALQTHHPAILPKPVGKKPIALSHVTQTTMSSVTATSVMTSPTSVTAAVLAGNHSAPSEDLATTTNVQCVSSAQLSESTGMEIQSLMNIVYGHSLDKGRLQASENLMSSNALSHPQPIYQPDPQFYEANNQTKNTPPSIGINQSGAEKGFLNTSYINSNFTDKSKTFSANSVLATQDVNCGGISNQTVLNDSESRYAEYQPTVNNMAVPHEQGDMLIQQAAMQDYHKQSEQFGVGQEVDLSHTERLNHLAQGECYQYSGDAVDHASYMYCQQGNVRNDVPHNYHHKQYYHSHSGEGTLPENGFTSQGYGEKHLIHSTGDQMFAQQDCNRPELNNSSEETTSEGNQTILEDVNGKVASSEAEEFIYCLDCNKMFEGSCKVHSTDYAYIEDTVVLTKAKASLPSCFYLKQTEATSCYSLGVWCKETVSSKTKFGPVVGPLEAELNDPSQKIDTPFNPFKIFQKNQTRSLNMSDKNDCNSTLFIQLATSLPEQNCVLYQQGRKLLISHRIFDILQIFQKNETRSLNMSDENDCNWTLFIQLATSLLEQNCVLYQQGRELFIITQKEMKTDSELLMWFSSDLCAGLKVSQDPAVCKLVQCSLCGKLFTTKKLIRLHRQLKHPSEVKSSWPCYICGRSYSSQSKLNSHMMVHMGMKPHRCIYCNKEFSDHSNLKVHQYIHTGQKKYKCTTCNRTFRQKAHLNSHLVTHTGEKNKKCRFCDKAFARQSDCKLHEYQHTKERMYICEVCKKVFYKTQTFKRHQKVHTGERNYMCNKCFKGFHTKYHRDRHLKICKEKNGKESTYMTLEEVANLDNTCDAVPLTVKAHEGCI